jgi:hypothetical protein
MIDCTLHFVDAARWDGTDHHVRLTAADKPKRANSR